MVEFIQNLIGNDLWATIIMSFVPLIELKGGIVFARGVGFNFLEAFFFSISRLYDSVYTDILFIKANTCVAKKNQVV